MINKSANNDVVLSKVKIKIKFFNLFGTGIKNFYFNIKPVEENMRDKTYCYCISNSFCSLI